MVAQIGSIEAQINADSSGFTQGIGAATDALSGLVGKLGKGKAAIAGLAAGAAAAAAGGLAAATKQAAQFQRTIAGAAARAGATQRAFERFGQSAKQASLDSAFGANEAGGALRFLAKSGFEVEQATAALPGVLRGATAAGMGAAEMGEIASNALRAFGRSASQTSQVMDVLVAASTNANTSVQELGQGISIVGGLANKAGMDIESTAAIMAKLQDAGISASRAATAMRAGISRLLDPTGDAQTALQTLGVSAKNAQGNFRGLIPVLRDLESSGASNAQMLKIFGRRAGPTLQTALAQGGSALSQFEQKMQNADGTTREIAGFIRDSATEQLKVLGGTIKTLAIEIGELLLPALQGITRVMQGITKFTSTMVSVVKNVDQAFGGWALSLEETSSKANRAKKSTEGMGRAAQVVQSQLRGQKREQDALNRSVAEFIQLQNEAKREAFSTVKKNAQQVQQNLSEAQSSMESAKKFLAAVQQVEGVDLESRFGALPEPSEGTVEFVKDLERAEVLAETRREKIRQVVRLRSEIPQIQKRVNKAARKVNAAADAKITKQRKDRNLTAQTADQARRLKEEMAEVKRGEAFKSEPFGGFQSAEERGRARKKGERLQRELERSKEAGVAFKPGAEKGVSARKKRKQTAPVREFAAQGEKNLKTLEGMTSNVRSQKQIMQQNVQAMAQFANTAGQAAGHLMQAMGASDQTTKVINAAISGASGLATAMAAAAAASWSTASAISVATAGISAVAGTIAAAASAAGEKPGSQNISTGGTTAAGGARRNQRNFADMLAKRIADEQEKRDIFRQEITIAGRSPGRRGRNDQPIDRLRETNDRLEEVEALEGV